MPYCCNPLTVAEGKKLRLVLDLRNVNPYVQKKKYRYEDLDAVTDILNTNDYFTMFDLVSAYYHINIHPEFYKYLGFQWNFRDGKTRYFMYTVLVFGLSTAGYVFTKTMRCLVTHWRRKGLRVLFYLDDGMNIASSYTNCQGTTKTISKDLQSAGFLVNFEKSEVEPKQSGEWLGVHIDTKKMIYAVPEKKIEKLIFRLNDVCSRRIASARLLSNIAGTLSSMKRSLGPIVALMTRCDTPISSVSSIGTVSSPSASIATTNLCSGKRTLAHATATPSSRTIQHPRLFLRTQANTPTGDLFYSA